MVNLIMLLLVFMIIAAIVAIWTTDLLSAVIAVGAVGFGSSVAFLLLSAPDVALTQIVVEVLTLVLLIRATVGREVRTVSGGRDVMGTAVAGALVLVLIVFAVGALGTLPEFGVPAVSRIGDAPSATYLTQGLSRTGSGNIVTAVLLDFRAFDTLGEATVLFAAVLGALALLRRRSRTAQEEGD
ncbi:MAG: hydrogen gas-evolving membrane-bound hydrogenase subunit E [Planctomycetota bacterium]